MSQENSVNLLNPNMDYQTQIQTEGNPARKLGLGEEKYKILAENFQGCSNNVIYIRIQGNLTANIAKTALSWLQKRHRLLQCNFAEYDSRYNQFDFSHYLSVKEEEKINEVPLTVITMSGDNHWQEIFDAELNTNFSADTKYLWQVTLLNGDDIHDLIFKFSHAICDGTSLKYFVRDFLAYCADLAEGCSIPKDFKVEPILPPVEELLPKRKTKSSQLTQDEQIEVSPWRYETYQPLEKRRTGWMFHIFNSETLNNLQKACDEQKVKLNSALSVVFLNAVNIVLGDRDKDETFRNLSIPIDLRLFCKPKVKPYQLGDFVDVLTLVNPATNKKQGLGLESFWDSVRFYETNLTKEMKKYVTSNRELTYKKSRVKSTILYLVSEKDKEQELTGGVQISNLGVLNTLDFSEKLKVQKNIFLRNDLLGFSPMYLVVYILDRQLHCGLIYTKGLVKAESVSTIVDNFRETIKQI